MPFTAKQMYDLVADVGAYPKFLPWTAAARVRRVSERADGARVMEADLVISFKLFRERFGSLVTLWDDAATIRTEYLDGPFQHMQSNWRFEEAENGCVVHFDVDFAFRNRLLQSAAELFFHDAMKRVVRAFEARAEELYGHG